MRRAWVVLLLSGCFNPDDLIPIRGSVGVADQRVELLRAPTCRAEFSKLEETRADVDGAFSFDVFRAQVQSVSSFAPQCVRVQTHYASGTRAESTIRELALGTELPPFVDWKPGLTRDGGALSFTNIEAGEFPVAHRVTASSDGGVAWTQSDLVLDANGSHFEPLIIDERVLGEFAATLTLEGTYGKQNDYSVLPDVTQRERVELHSSEALEVPATFVPVSRGAACDELPSPCAITDGSLADFSFPRGEWPSQLTLRFTSPVTPTLLVVRGLAFHVQREDVLDEAGKVFTTFFTLPVTGLTADGREIELVKPRVFYDPTAEEELDASGMFSLAPASSFLAPLNSPEPLVGVRLRAERFHRVREISVF